MKTLIFLFTVILICTSVLCCKNQRSKEVASLPAADNSRHSTSPDTIMYGGKVIPLESMDSIAFEKLPGHNPWGDTAQIIDDTIDVLKRDSTLILRFNNGDSAVLVSRPNDAGESYKGYSYIREIKKLNSYIVQNVWYEFSDYSLWNKNSGREQKIFSYPCISPDGKKVLCYSMGMFNDEGLNGFQVFEVTRDSLRLLWQHESQWGSDDCRWKDANTIGIKATYMDSDAFLSKYVSLRLPAFK